MQVTRRSMVSGQEHTLDLPVTPEQMALYEAGWLAQDVFPDLTPAQREFLISGTTPEEWQEFIADPEDEGDDEE